MRVLTEFSQTVESFTQDYQWLYATYTSYRDMLREVLAERDQLRAEVERLRADAERMDWLEKCPATQLPKDSEAMRRWLWHRPAGAGNIRAAIDHARTTQKD